MDEREACFPEKKEKILTIRLGGRGERRTKVKLVEVQLVEDENGRVR